MLVALTPMVYRGPARPAVLADAEETARYLKLFQLARAAPSTEDEGHGPNTAEAYVGTCLIKVNYRIRRL